MQNGEGITVPDLNAQGQDIARHAWNMTLEDFTTWAQFVRTGKSRRLFVLAGVTMYEVKDQKRGKLTKSPDDVLAGIWNREQTRPSYQKCDI